MPPTKCACWENKILSLNRYSIVTQLHHSACLCLFFGPKVFQIWNFPPHYTSQVLEEQPHQPYYHHSVVQPKLGGSLAYKCQVVATTNKREVAFPSIDINQTHVTESSHCSFKTGGKSTSVLKHNTHIIPPVLDFHKVRNDQKTSSVVSMGAVYTWFIERLVHTVDVTRPLPMISPGCCSKKWEQTLLNSSTWSVVGDSPYLM